jgi:hypothetical protein
LFCIALGKACLRWSGDEDSTCEATSLRSTGARPRRSFSLSSHGRGRCCGRSLVRSLT